MIHSGACLEEVREFSRDFLASFETGEQVTNYRLKLPENVEVELIGLDWEVVKALAATDAGLITIKDSAGNTIATISATDLPASAALGVRNSSPTAALAAAGTDALMERRRVRVSGYITVTAAKTTAGGKVACQLHFRKLRKGYSK